MSGFKSIAANESTEIECKYLIDKETVPKVRLLISELAKKGSLIVAGVRKIKIKDTYYDTSTHFLASEECSIRLRKRPKRPLKITLKKVPKQQDSNVRLVERYELENVATSDFVLRVLSESPLAFEESLLSTKPMHRWRAKKILRKAGLKKSLTIKNTREIHTLVTEDNTTIEISIDQGRLQKGRTRKKFRELEIELLSGSTEVLTNLCELIEGDIEGLVSCTTSKYHRGLILINDSENTQSQLLNT